MEIIIKGQCPHCNGMFGFSSSFKGAPIADINEVERITFDLLKKASINAYEKDKIKSNKMAVKSRKNPISGSH